jgi:hypothetical protein
MLIPKQEVGISRRRHMSKQLKARLVPSYDPEAREAREASDRIVRELTNRGHEPDAVTPKGPVRCSGGCQTLDLPDGRVAIWGRSIEIGDREPRGRDL